MSLNRGWTNRILCSTNPADACVDLRFHQLANVLFQMPSPSPAKPRKTLAQGIRKQLWKLYDHLVKWFLVPPARLLQACGCRYRFVNIAGNWIGHLAIEPDLFLKEGLLGWRQPFKEIWLAPRDQLANRHLFTYWARQLRTVESPLLARLLLPLARSPQLGYDVKRYAVAIDDSALYPKIQSAWNDRPPLLSLTEADRAQGWAALKKLGLPDGAWFVCFHCREAGYAPFYEQTHQYRDADILTFIPAMEAVVALGGWCIRVGDNSMKPLPPMPKVIDYAHHEIKSEFMDIFLCAACKCFIGTSSGLALVPGVFGVPVAMSNQAPLSAVLPYGNCDLGIPKLLWSTRTQRLLTFKAVLDSPLADYRSTELYQRAEVTMVDNTPDELRELTLELLTVADRQAVGVPEDEVRQRQFKALMRPGHYSFGAQARVGRHFLKKHAALLQVP